MLEFLFDSNFKKWFGAFVILFCFLSWVIPTLNYWWKEFCQTMREINEHIE